jgi:hypothetical protein
MQYRIQKNILPCFSDEIIKKAMQAPLAAYPDFDKVNTDEELAGSTALLYLLFVEHYYSEKMPVSRELLRERILCHLRSLLSSGNEPSMKAGPVWAQPITSAAIALAKSTASVWSRLVEAEVNKFDLIMKAFAVTSSWATSDQNDFYTGPCMRGNFKKSWNPNHRYSSVFPIMMASIYFGSSEFVDNVLINFSYDEFMNEFKDAGFNNILRSWGAAGAELFEQGGKCFIDGKAAGEGKGVKYPYVYRDIPLKDTVGLMNELLMQNISSHPVSDYYENDKGQRGGLPAGFSSPYLGMMGMMKEFRAGDGHGLRSDVIYCASNFCILVPVLAVMIELGYWNPDDEKNSEVSRLTVISILDFKYKLQSGYMSYSKGEAHYHTEKDIHGGYIYANDIWKAILSQSDTPCK